MGVHHAWGRTYKDAYQRYFAMTGHELRYQNGFDCQGLWVEVEVEKELEPAARKRDIENLVPGDRVREHRPTFVAALQGPRGQVRPRADRAVDPPRLLDGLGPHRRGLGEAARTSGKSYFTMSEENNYTIWTLPQEVPRPRAASTAATT